MPNSDAQLMQRAAAGDQRAFTDLYNAHHRRAVREARRRTSNQQAAEDAVAVAFARVFRVLQNGTPIEHFRAYLLTAVRNAVIAATRSRSSTERPIEIIDDDVTDDALSDAGMIQLNGAMARAFDSLSDRHQHALWRSSVEQYSNSEIGRELALRANSVAALTMRARDSLLAAYVAEVTFGVDIHDWIEDTLAEANGRPLCSEKQLVIDYHLDTCEECAEKRRRVAGAWFTLPAALLASGVRRPASTFPSETHAPLRVLTSNRAAIIVLLSLGLLGVTAAAGTTRDDQPDAQAAPPPPVTPTTTDGQTPRHTASTGNGTRGVTGSVSHSEGGDEREPDLRSMPTTTLLQVEMTEVTIVDILILPPAPAESDVVDGQRSANATPLATTPPPTTPVTTSPPPVTTLPDPTTTVPPQPTTTLPPTNTTQPTTTTTTTTTTLPPTTTTTTSSTTTTSTTTTTIFDATLPSSTMPVQTLPVINSIPGPIGPMPGGFGSVPTTVPVSTVFIPPCNGTLPPATGGPNGISACQP